MREGRRLLEIVLDDPRQLNQSLPPYPLSAWVHFRCGDVEPETGRVVQTVESVTGSGTVLEPLLPDGHNSVVSGGGNTG